MRYLLSILLFFPLLIQGQYQVSPVVKPVVIPIFRTVYEKLAAIDSTAFDRYYATLTFQLGPTGITIAEIDTSDVAALTDTIRFYITGSSQPTPYRTILNASLDTSLQVGAAGIVLDSVTLNAGEIYIWSGGNGKNISEVIYTIPDTADVFTLSSPGNDTVIYQLNTFPALADGTIANVVHMRADTAGAITAITDGWKVFEGDTIVHDTLIVEVADDNTTVYFGAFPGNSGPFADTTYNTVFNVFEIDVDSIGDASPYGATFDSIYNAFSSAPHDTAAAKMNTFVQTLVDSGVWAKLDILHFYATNNGTDALLNLISPSLFTATNVSATQFDAWEGFTGDGSADHIAWNWNPNSDGVNFIQNDASIGGYIINDIDEDGAIWGIYDGTAANIIKPHNGSNCQWWINGDAGETTFTSTAAGFWMLTREGANTSDLYQNNNALETAPGVSSGVTNREMVSLAYDNQGSIGSFSTNQLSMDFAGSNLTLTDRRVLMNAFEVWMVSNGKGVIP